MTSSSQKGQFDFVVPYNPIIKKSNKQVKMTVKEMGEEKNQAKKLLIWYKL